MTKYSVFGANGFIVLSHSRDHRPFKKHRKGKINSRVSPMCGNVKAQLQMSQKCHAIRM